MEKNKKEPQAVSQGQNCCCLSIRELQVSHKHFSVMYVKKSRQKRIKVVQNTETSEIQTRVLKRVERGRKESDIYLPSPLLDRGFTSRGS